MTDNTNTGGPAFPALARYDRAAQLQSALQQDGMTLRDYFAAKCFANLVHRREPFDAAKEAYQFADAMLKVRGE